MNNRRKKLIMNFTAWAGVALVTACSDNSFQVSTYPLITDAVGVGPWQVITYDDELVMKDKVVLDGLAFKTRSEPVYINSKSQFVYRDGRAIRDYMGNRIYWNDQGFIINKNVQILPENVVFSLNGSPLPVGTPLKLRGYSQPVELASSIGDSNSNGAL